MTPSSMSAITMFSKLIKEYLMEKNSQKENNVLQFCLPVYIQVEGDH